jgi:outer membrane cobalamin receptor
MTLLLSLPLCAQREKAELRLRVLDAVGLSIPASAELVSLATQTRIAVHLHPDGTYNFKNVPFASYRLTVTQPGFQSFSELIDLRSEVPASRLVTLGVAPVELAIRVEDRETLLNPQQVGSNYHLGATAIENRTTGSAGRSLLDMISSQPGWLLEANGVLHPRGSEYATQYVVDGFPIQDNRSPAFAPSFDADDVQELQVLTGAYPAEYGKKLGGVIAVTTQRNTTPGLHNSAVIQGGSFSMMSGFFSTQYTARKSTASLSAEGFLTDRYLDPPVERNFTNHASNTGVTGSWERDLSAADRLRASFSRRATRFLVPDELLQQNAGQRQDRTSLESAGQISYQHVFSPDIAGSVRAMVRDISAQLWSNPLSTPIYASQDRGFRESYVNADLAGHHGRHIWKVGTEESFASIHEAFAYKITAYRIGTTRIFDRDTPAQLAITDRRQDREQSAFAQDQVRFGNVTLSAGLRYDHYSLLVTDQAWSPRLAAAWYIPAAKLVVHASYDRIFGTPAIENLLVSASPVTSAINNAGFYLPLRPSHANFVEAGFSKSVWDKVRIDANWFRRAIRNFGDDEVLLNTGVSFPIAFDRATIHGVDVKVEVPQWGRFSGFASYSWMVGLGQLPIAGGLFLDDSAASLLQGNEKFPITQDQRHTAHARLRYNVSSRLWAAVGAYYASGLPTELADGQSQEFLVSQYGQAIVNSVNFEAGRVRPSFALDASVGAQLWRKEAVSIRLQADALNLTDRLNVINFAGLLSGTAIAPPRSFGLRLRAEF